MVPEPSSTILDMLEANGDLAATSSLIRSGLVVVVVLDVPMSLFWRIIVRDIILGQEVVAALSFLALPLLVS